MSKKRVQVVLTLEIESDAEIVEMVVRDVSSMPSPPESSLPGTDGLPAMALRMIEEFAPPSMAPFQLAFAQRCVDELSLEVEPPSGSRTYLNVYPPKRYGSKRATAWETKSGRAEIYCDPTNADRFEHAEVVLHNNEPHAVKVYLSSPEAVDQAIELVRVGLAERS